MKQQFVLFRLEETTLEIEKEAQEGAFRPADFPSIEGIVSGYSFRVFIKKHFYW